MTEKEANRARKRQVNFRLSEAEYAILEDKAKKAKMNISNYLRHIVLLSAVVDRGLPADRIRPLLNELNRIGNNINQIAYNTNYRRSVIKEDFDGLADEYRKLLRLFDDEFVK